MFELCIYLQKLKQTERVNDSPGSFRLCDFAICTLRAKERDGAGPSTASMRGKKLPSVIFWNWIACIYLVFRKKAFLFHEVIGFWMLFGSLHQSSEATKEYYFAGWFSHLARLCYDCPRLRMWGGFLRSGISGFLWHTKCHPKRPNKKWRSERYEKPRRRKVICIDVFFCKAIWL